MKRLVLVLFTVLASTPVLYSQQFTKTGVVDMTRIYSQFYNESKGVREFEDLKAGIQKQIDGFKEEIRQLNDQKKDALGKGDSNKAANLDQDIQKKQDALKEFARVKQEELKAKNDSVKSDNSFQKTVVTEIEQAAVAKGYSLILNVGTQGILWFSPDADITDDVIARLSADFGH